MTVMNATVCPVLSHLPTKPAACEDIAHGEHIVAAHTAARTGPTLIVIGGLHGNEPAGLHAMEDVASLLKERAAGLRGRVYLIAGNTRALRRRVRFIDHDLNRAWTREHLDAASMRSSAATAEENELAELDTLLDQILITADDEVYVLDLHSTSASGVPFATLGDTIRNRAFATKFPVRLLLGVEEQLDGTMLEYFIIPGRR
jgi:succinylglutamate desuccinylase